MTARPAALSLLFAIGSILCPALASAQGAGGLYIASGQYSFANAVRQGLADNPGGGRFYVLAVPPATQALLASGANPEDADLRSRAREAGVQFLVCRRDVQNGSVISGNLVPGVGVVWGWPEGPDAPAPDANNLFPGESASEFPASMELMRRIRSTCSE